MNTGVAGGHSPAFVERPWSAVQRTAPSGVAGGHSPAFVERQEGVNFVILNTKCRRGSLPGLR